MNNLCNFTFVFIKRGICIQINISDSFFVFCQKVFWNSYRSVIRRTHCPLLSPGDWWGHITKILRYDFRTRIKHTVCCIPHCMNWWVLFIYLFRNHVHTMLVTYSLMLKYQLSNDSVILFFWESFTVRILKMTFKATTYSFIYVFVLLWWLTIRVVNDT